MRDAWFTENQIKENTVKIEVLTDKGFVLKK